MKTKIIPFDLETAKKIQAGEIKGKIVTTVGGAARIVCFDKKTDTRHPLVVLIHDLLDPDIESVGCYTTKGEVVGDKIYNLCIELPEETPICNNPNSPRCKVCSNYHCNDCQYNEPQFKPFDKVLVRNKSNETWHPSLYATTDGLLYYTIDCKNWQQCIPYEGNEHLVGTTDKPE